MASIPSFDANTNQRVEMFSLVWLDANPSVSQNTEQKLRSIINQFKNFQDILQCQEFIQKTSVNDRIILVVSGRLGREIVPKIHQFRQIISIYVYCMNKQANEEWSSKYSKVKQIFIDLDELCLHIKTNYRIEKRLQEPLAIHIFSAEENSTDVLFQVLIDCLLKLKSTYHDQRQLVGLLKSQYTGNTYELNTIKTFQVTYRSNDILQWYTKECFFSKTLNSILRNEDIHFMFLYRSLIYDIQQQLQKHQPKQIIQVYRSQIISKDELEILKKSINKFISFNSFLSTTMNYKRAFLSLNLSKSTENTEKILFIIQADPTIAGKTKPFAHISRFSENVDDEEVLFMTRSTFRLNNISFDDKYQYWIIQMTLSPSDNKQLQENINLRVLSKILWRMEKFDLAEQYLKRFLKQIPLHDAIREDIYEDLAEIASQLGDFEKSAKWRQKSIEFEPNDSDNFPKENINYGRNVLHNPEPPIIPKNIKNHIILHANANQKRSYEYIIHGLNRLGYYVELQVDGTYHSIKKNVLCLICCLSKDYEKDYIRQCELQYAFKTQQSIIPIRIESNFVVQQLSLQCILDSLTTSIIDISGSNELFEQVHKEILNISQDKKIDMSSNSKKLNYTTIYQQCRTNGWNKILKLFFYIPVVYFYNNIEKMIQQMYKLNNRLNANAQIQINHFHQWLLQRNEPLNISVPLFDNLHPIKRQTIDEFHSACERNDIQQVRTILRSYPIDDLRACEKSLDKTALHIASKQGHHQIIQLLLEHNDFMMKSGRLGMTPLSQAKDDVTRQTLIRFHRPLLRFMGNLIEWTKPYAQASIKSAQIREYLSRDQFIRQNFRNLSYQYIYHYLVLEGFPTTDITKLEQMGYSLVTEFLRAYTSSTRLHRYINRHLATHALNFFNSTFDPSIPYNFIFCLLSIVAKILQNCRLQVSFIGDVYRGMTLKRDEFERYVVNSHILNTTFLSTSEDCLIAEIFAGIHPDDPPTEDNSSDIKILCKYEIRNKGTAYNIRDISLFDTEKEVLIFPFSAFRVSRVNKTSSGRIQIDLIECTNVTWEENNANYQLLAYNSTE